MSSSHYLTMPMGSKQEHGPLSSYPDIKYLQIEFCGVKTSSSTAQQKLPVF